MSLPKNRHESQMRSRETVDGRDCNALHNPYQSGARNRQPKADEDRPRTARAAAAAARRMDVPKQAMSAAYASRIALAAQPESFRIALPTPIRSATPSASSASACSGSVTPPVRITGMETARLIGSVSSAK